MRITMRITITHYYFTTTNLYLHDKSYYFGAHPCPAK